MSVKGANRTILDSATDVHTLAPGKQGGKVRVMTDSYECVNTAANTVILMGSKIPVGAIITGVTLATDNLGVGVTCDVGDLESSARFINDAACNAANSVARLGLTDGLNYVVDETDETNTDRQITVIPTGNTCNGTIQIVVEYTYE